LPCCRVTRIGCAGIVVIAVLRYVVTSPCKGITYIISAKVVIWWTNHCWVMFALPCSPVAIIVCARIEVITVFLGVLASAIPCKALVNGAWVIVVAIHRYKYTKPCDWVAAIDGAKVSIITNPWAVFALASLLVASIGCACVSIIARDGKVKTRTCCRIA